MLVLSRKQGEVIRIGDSITITVVEIKPGRVRLGINAPPDILVDRQEVYEKKQLPVSRQNQPGSRTPQKSRRLPQKG